MSRVDRSTILVGTGGHLGQAPEGVPFRYVACLSPASIRAGVCGDALTSKRILMNNDTLGAFYELARSLASTEGERLERAEMKAWRHLYTLVVLLGFAFVSSARTVLAHLSGPYSALGILFTSAFGLFLLCSFAAGIVSLFNFRVALTLEPPANESLEKFALSTSADRFHLVLGREFMRSVAETRQVADRKFRLLIWSFRFLFAAVILGMALSVMYPFLSGS